MGRVLGEQTLGLPRLKSTSEQPAQEEQSHLGALGLMLTMAGAHASWASQGGWVPGLGA